MKRRSFILATLGSGWTAQVAWATPELVEVYKSPTCGCCSAWVAHMAGAGFRIDAQDVDQHSLSDLKARAGIAPDFASCHTAFARGYFVEGHVPADDVLRLLSERPDALGLTVPGMPVGSPGMEVGDQREAFDTLLVRRDGSVEVFSRHV